MGTKRGKGERTFVLETKKQAMSFYRSIVQDLRGWQPSAPKLPVEPDEAQETPAPEPPPFSTPDRREPGEAVDPSGVQAGSRVAENARGDSEP
jgi:hypothetical protein